MSSTGDLLDSLGGAPVIFSAMVFLAVFIAVLSVGRRFILSPAAVEREPPSAADLARRVDLERRPPEPARPAGRALEIRVGFSGRPTLLFGSGRPDPLLGAKRVMGKAFRVVSAVIVTALATLTYIFYRESTPGTGDVLLSIVAAILTLFTALHLLRIDKRYNQPPDPVATAELHRRSQADLASKIQQAISGQMEVDWKVASPEVHTIDSQGLAIARAMSAQGKSIDEICQATQSEYAHWGPAHQQAFRNVIQAALDHS